MSCINYSGPKNTYGYGIIYAYSRGKSFHILAHRQAWEEQHGPIPKGMCVCHKCDNRACINVDHLFLGTHADNMRDKTEKGRQSRGERHSLAVQKGAPRGSDVHSARLTEKDVLEIYRSDRTERELAQAFGVSQVAIHYIKTGRTWKHVTQIKIKE